ncbi:MAG: hypothetical protein N0A24_09010 [Armatimonadetes bacterium]|nr:hypothetical protein [Armatimonadota bacterium]MDW8154329.1 DUF411 domain-containing protein [Armatimonadota bacterium]
MRRKRGRKVGWGVLALGVAVSVGWWVLGRPAQEGPTPQWVLYQNPGCGCCGKYADYLRGLGYAIRVVRTAELQAVKERLRVPRQLWSCHTVTVGRYFVEGHVPAQAVEELLRRAPPWLGIALPGMPSGSPGMDGPRRAPLVVYAVTHQGTWREFGRF